jgi:mono/diheme cytochrome c family protein
MRSIVLGLGILVMASTVASAQDATVAKGQQVYADQKCALCHSIGDKGNKKGPLDVVGSKLSAADLRLWMTDAKAMTEKTKSTRKPEMKSYNLPKADLDALIAYMQSLKKG